MKRIIFPVLTGLLVLGGCKEGKKVDAKLREVEQNIKENTYQIKTKEEMVVHFNIEILDDEALDIIDPKTNINIEAAGFTWTEGPLWVEKDKYLLFSDIPKNKVYKLDSNKDTITYLHPSGFSGTDYTGVEPGSNGLLLNNKDELVLMQHGNRAVSVMESPMSDPKENYESLVNNYKGKRLNSPNDGLFDRMGNLYFTDPPYGLPEGLKDLTKELDFQGVYCLLTTRELVLLDDKIKFPNGLTISQDGKTLYVAESNPFHAVWYKYDIVAPGKLENKAIFHDVTYLVQIGADGGELTGLPDGLKINKNEIIFATGPDGVWIFNPDGRVLARIHTGQKTANCALTTDGKKLYMTAHNYILSVDLK